MSCVSWCKYTEHIPTKKDQDSQLITWEIELSTFSNYGWNQLLKVFRGVAPDVPTQFYWSCHSTASGRLAPGTELSGDGYARTPITFERVSDIKLWNPSDVTSAAATANWDDIVSFGLYDSLTGGNYWAYGNLVTPISVTASKALKILANKAIIGGGSES